MSGSADNGSAETVLQQLTLAGIPVEPKSTGWIASIRAYRKDSAEEGGLVMKSQAAALLEVTVPRISQMTNAGLLDEFEHFGKKMISARQIEALHRARRTTGKKGALISSALKATFRG